MKQYLDLVRHVMENGEDRMDRTGVGTRSVFGYQTRYNLQDGFPLVTTKFTSLKTIIKELVWYLRGDGNVKFLQDNGVTIWNEWADSNGDLGKVYPHQWMNWEKYEVVNYSDHLSLDDTTMMFYNAKVKVSKINQFDVLIDGLKNNPASRRHIVSAWNVSDLDKMALPPCHAFFQFHVSTSGKLSCHLTQRSGDVPLGIPYNIACYSVMTHILAKICGYQVGEFVHTISDTHVYHNQFDGVKELLTRTPYPLPKLIVPETLTDINQLINGEITWDDFKLEGYQYHPRIDFPVAV